MHDASTQSLDIENDCEAQGAAGRRTIPASVLAEYARLGISLWRGRDGLQVLAAFQEQAGHPCLHPLALSHATHTNVVCIHALDGSVYKYRHIAAELPDGYSAYGVQVLQWIAEDSAPRCVEEIAARYCTYIMEGLSPEKEMVLYGASSGGLIALEMAQRLSAMGRNPALVVLADTRDDLKQKAPALGVLFDRLLWMGFLELYLPPELLDLRPANHPFWSMDEDDRLEYLIQRAHRGPASPSVAPLQADRLKLLLAAYRRYFHSYAGYRPQPYAGRALYIMGSAVSARYSEEVRSQLRGYCRLTHVDGGHTAVLEPPGTARIAKLIVEEMNTK